MTLSKGSSGDILKLGVKDWIGLIVLITSAAISIYIRMEMVDGHSEDRVERLREELARESPAPARWTVDAVNRIDGEISDLRRVVADMSRLDTQLKVVVQKQEQTTAKLDVVAETAIETKTIIKELKDRMVGK